MTNLLPQKIRTRVDTSKATADERSIDRRVAQLRKVPLYSVSGGVGPRLASS
jgi:hypothetical protein